LDSAARKLRASGNARTWMGEEVRAGTADAGAFFVGCCAVTNAFEVGLLKADAAFDSPR